MDDQFAFALGDDNLFAFNFFFYLLPFTSICGARACTDILKIKNQYLINSKK